MKKMLILGLIVSVSSAAMCEQTVPAVDANAQQQATANKCECATTENKSCGCTAQCECTPSTSETAPTTPVVETEKTTEADLTKTVDATSTADVKSEKSDEEIAQDFQKMMSELDKEAAKEKENTPKDDIATQEAIAK